MVRFPCSSSASGSRALFRWLEATFIIVTISVVVLEAVAGTGTGRASASTLDARVLRSNVAVQPAELVGTITSLVHTTDSVTLYTWDSVETDTVVLSWNGSDTVPAWDDTGASTETYSEHGTYGPDVRGCSAVFTSGPAYPVPGWYRFHLQYYAGQPQPSYTEGHFAFDRTGVWRGPGPPPPPGCGAGTYVEKGLVSSFYGCPLQTFTPAVRTGDNFSLNCSASGVDGYTKWQVTDTGVLTPRISHVTPSITWDNQQGGLKLRYHVSGGPLTQPQDVGLSFATAPTYASRTDPVLYSLNVPAGTADGDFGPFHVEGGLLVNAPAGTADLLASTTPTDYGATADVHLDFGPRAVMAVVSPRMIRAIKESLRVAGQAQATITSTARTEEDQARIMFQNLTNPAHTIAQDIAAQRSLYLAAGNAVITTFQHDVQGLSRVQVLRDQRRIRADMEGEIDVQGCPQVSHHCADPATRSVVDVSAAPFTAQNASLFMAAARAKVTTFLDERMRNQVFHLELVL